MPPARLFDETLKLFLTGHGARSFEVLRRRGLLASLLPSVDAYLGSAIRAAWWRSCWQQGLENTDARVQADKPVTPTFLFALLLYGPIAAIIETHAAGALARAGHDPRCLRSRACARPRRHVTIPKRFSLGVRDMFALQPRLEHPRGRRALRLLEQPRFRAAYDLLLLRAQLGLAPRRLAQWWTRLQEVARRGARPHGGCARRRAPRAAGAAERDGGSRRRRRGAGAGPQLTPVPWTVWQPAYIGVGSNLDDPQRAGRAALPSASARCHGRVVVLVSRLYRSRPFGPVPQPDFVNAVAGLLTQLNSARTAAGNARSGERRSAVRPQRERWGPRILDLDLLAYGA